VGQSDPAGEVFAPLSISACLASDFLRFWARDENVDSVVVAIDLASDLPLAMNDDVDLAT
jgi:hypothetical protein